jgi:Flp pilus assembly protein TadD
MIETEEGNYDGALAWVEKALSLSPREAYFLNNRGYIYLRMKEFEKAEVDINESIAFDPYNAWAYRNKGIFMLEKKDYANAERLLRQSVDMDPFVDMIYFYLGLAYQNNGNTTKACESFKKSEAQGDGVVSADLMKGCK